MRLLTRHSALPPLLISALFALLAVVYARAMPPFEAADEAPHFLYTHYLLEEGRLPPILSREQIGQQPTAALRWMAESHQPPLYYALGALLIAWSERADLDDYLRSNDLIFIRGVTAGNHNQWLHTPGRGAGDTALPLNVLRAYSIVLGILTLWLVYLAAREVFPGTIIPALAMLLAACTPTFISISASYNNDNLVTMLYSAGVYLCLRLWRRGHIARVDAVLLSLALAAIALTKLNGLSLFGVVYGMLIVGVWRGRFERAPALQFAALSLLATGLLAGWWYARNLSLYGDPFALAATRTLWGRAFEIAATSGDPLAEAWRIFRSFWLMMGHLHLPVYGPAWVYVYALIITLLGAAGVIRLLRAPRGPLLLLLAVCAGVTFTLLSGTRSVDISYGRLLFPALAGIAPLLVAGWRASVGRRLAVLLIAPLAITALLVPLRDLPRAYPALRAVESVPASARFIGVDAEGITLLAYAVRQDVARPSAALDIDVYLRGTHPDDPALFVTALDAITLERLGHLEVFPGMAALSALPPDRIYRARLRLPLDDFAARGPRRIDLRLIWHSPSVFREIPLVDGAGTPVSALIVPGPTLYDARYAPPAPGVRMDVVYGGAIRLEGFTLSAGRARAGETIALALHWGYVARLADDWTVAVQMVDAAGTIIAQADGMPAGYPTSAWRAGPAYVDTRRITIPENTAPGVYRLLVGWYRLADFASLQVEGTGSGLTELPAQIEVVP